ncbi:SPOR domain-containing protein [Cochlodiniinecator piscidefendens]|uniref:SPOR domain-containing protein n=1 Tax=Cochlodiniinecator piscidefendens TaxID=2715756 RepID=UPI001409C8EC|nr:SPOR domain-containing protein [Cochlodiniinecator piscidefendens]
MADVEFDDSYGYDPTDKNKNGSSVPVIAGALMSLALIAGLGTWTYRLAVRDVTGVPVVRAIEGPMRIQPVEPGGEQARHQGLSVNQVQAAGEAAPAADRLVLAPEPVGILPSDQPITEERPVVSAPINIGEATDSPVLVSAETVIPEGGGLSNLVDQLIDGTAPLGELTEIDDATQSPLRVAATVPGVAVSLRPQPRPSSDVIAQALATAQSVSLSEPSTQNTDEVAASSIAAGTRLVQLGAYDSADLARQEWARIAGQFEDYFEGKSRVIQEATSGGRSFFRLRVLGFDGLSDTRRFCSVLLARETACIPVVVR